MKPLLLTTFILMISLLGFSQEKNMERLEKAKSEMKLAAENENFQKAAELKKEIELREAIEKAKEVEDYQKAAELQTQLEGGTASKRKENLIEEKEFNLSTTKPSKGFVPPNPGNAAVYIVRPDNLMAYDYFHEDQFIGRFKKKGYLRYECKPGEHLFWASSENKEFITTELEADKIYVIRATTTRSGVFIAHVAFRLVGQDDSKMLSKIINLVNKVEADIISENELRRQNKRLGGFIQKELYHYENVTKHRYNFKHLSADGFIPADMLK